MECTRLVRMAKATGYAFAEKYFSKTVNTNVKSMVDNICNEMKVQIQRSDWLDDTTKKIVTDKIDDMGLFEGTPKWYKNRTYVLNAYKGVKLFNLIFIINN